MSFACRTNYYKVLRECERKMGRQTDSKMMEGQISPLQNKFPAVTKKPQSVHKHQRRKPCWQPTFLHRRTTPLCLSCTYTCRDEDKHYSAHTHTAKEHTGNTNSEGRKEVSIAIASEGVCVHNLENERGTAHWTALKSSSPHSSASSIARFFFCGSFGSHTPNHVYFFLLSTKPLVSVLFK